MAPLVAASKPFSPTVHVLILPTQLPLDMRHAFRNLDEFALVSHAAIDTRCPTEAPLPGDIRTVGSSRTI